MKLLVLHEINDGIHSTIIGVATTIEIAEEIIMQHYESYKIIIKEKADDPMFELDGDPIQLNLDWEIRYDLIVSHCLEEESFPVSIYLERFILNQNQEYSVDKWNT